MMSEGETRFSLEHEIIYHGDGAESHDFTIDGSKGHLRFSYFKDGFNGEYLFQHVEGWSDNRSMLGQPNIIIPGKEFFEDVEFEGAIDYSGVIPINSLILIRLEEVYHKYL